MIEPTDAQAAALALPGDDWDSGRRRARRLLNSVVMCEPCQEDGCDGWIEGDDAWAYCEQCSCRSGDPVDHLTGLPYPDV